MFYLYLLLHLLIKNLLTFFICSNTSEITNDLPEFARDFPLIGPRACDLLDASLALLSFAVFPAATLRVSTIKAMPDSQSSLERLLFAPVSVPLYVFGKSKKSHVPLRNV